MASLHQKDRFARPAAIAAGLSLLLFASLIIGSAEAPAADLRIGRISVHQGRVLIRRPGNADPIVVTRGGDFYAGDLLRVDADSLARAALSDGSIMIMAPASSVRVSQYDFDQGRNMRSAFIAVLHGLTRFVVPRQRGSGSVFAVESGAARIDAGSLADFSVAAAESVVEVAVLDHSVSVRSSSPVIIGTVAVGVNQRTVVREHMPPTKPDIITTAERKRYMVMNK